MTGGVTTTNDRVCEKDRVAMSVRDVFLRVCMCLCVCMRRVDVSHVMRRVCLSNVGEWMSFHDSWSLYGCPSYHILTITSTVSVWILLVEFINYCDVNGPKCTCS